MQRGERRRCKFCRGEAKPIRSPSLKGYTLYLQNLSILSEPQIQLWCWQCAPYKCLYYYYYYYYCNDDKAACLYKNSDKRRFLELRPLAFRVCKAGTTYIGAGRNFRGGMAVLVHVQTPLHNIWAAPLPSMLNPHAVSPSVGKHARYVWFRNRGFVCAVRIAAIYIKVRLGSVGRPCPIKTGTHRSCSGLTEPGNAGQYALANAILRESGHEVIRTTSLAILYYIILSAVLRLRNHMV